MKKQLPNNSRIKCNLCKKELDFWDMTEDYSIKGRLGYGTKYDGNDLELHICCECMNKLIDSCKISPITPVSEEEVFCR